MKKDTAGAPRPLDEMATLSPAYFGMVMATGIISLAAHGLSYHWTAHTLFYINVAAYGVIGALAVLRVFLYPQHFLADMTDYSRAPGFFTSVAASNVLAMQCMVLHDSATWAFVLWGLALALWLAFTYSIFLAFTIKSEKPTLQAGIHGGWLLAVVATQSVCVVTAQLVPFVAPQWRLEFNFFALSMWLWGGMLYIWLMALIFYRYNFFSFQPHELTPPYWINMGAMAISVLAGTFLIHNAESAPYLLSLLPFLKGFTVFYWAVGTWWIPMLLLLGLWRYVIKRFPLRYDPLYWGAVFPLGMYSAATLALSRVMDLPFLTPIPVAFYYAAMLAWCLAFAGLTHQLSMRVHRYARLRQGPHQS